MVCGQLQESCKYHAGLFRDGAENTVNESGAVLPGFMNGQKEGVEKGSFGNVEDISGELYPDSFAVITSLSCRHLKRLFIRLGNKG